MLARPQEALVVTDSVVKMPVMRPPIAMDKVDIMDKAKERLERMISQFRAI